MNNNTAMVLLDAPHAIQQAKVRYDIVRELMKASVLREGIDYGTIPGSSKPSLLKPGAERLCAAMGFNPQFELIGKKEIFNPAKPLFFYHYRCRLIHIDSGKEIATGIGSCNSMEAKYRWRWVDEDDVPLTVDKSTLKFKDTTISEFQFAVEKAETTGKYGKPAEYWQAFKDAIASGKAVAGTRPFKSGKIGDTWEIPGKLYQVPNDDIFSLVNTIDKMAQKRALIAAVLIGANASEFFTQDIEDMPGFGYADDVVTVEAPKLAVVDKIDTIEKLDAAIEADNVEYINDDPREFIEMGSNPDYPIERPATPKGSTVKTYQCGSLTFEKNNSRVFHCNDGTNIVVWGISEHFKAHGVVDAQWEAWQKAGTITFKPPLEIQAIQVKGKWELKAVSDHLSFHKAASSAQSNDTQRAAETPPVKKERPMTEDEDMGDIPF